MESYVHSYKKVRMTQHAHTNPVILMKLNPLPSTGVMSICLCWTCCYTVCSSCLFVACNVTVAEKLKVSKL